MITIHNPKTTVSSRKLGVSTSGGNLSEALDNHSASLTKLAALNGGLDISFDGGQFNWDRKLDLPEGVLLKAHKDTTIAAASSVDRMMTFPIGHTQGGLEGKFIVDSADNVSVAAIELEGDAIASLNGLTFLDTGHDQTTSASQCIRIAQAAMISISDVVADGTGRMIMLRGDGTGNGVGRVTLRNLTQLSPSHQAEMLYVSQGAEHVELTGSYVGAFPANVVGGHAIQTQAPTAGQFTGPVVVKDNLFACRPGVAWTAAGAANGAHGDLVVFRGVHDGLIEGNTMLDGGEYLIDILYGSRRCVVRSNKLHRADGSAIIVGTTLGTSEVVVDTLVERNEIVDCGLNQAQDLGTVASSSIHTKRDRLTTLRHNLIDGGTYGIHVNKADPSDSIHIYGNRITGTVAQAHGLPAIYTGQMAAPGLAIELPTSSRDTSHNTPVTHLATATGVIDGIALPLGTGDLDMPNAVGNAVPQWIATDRGDISIRRGEGGNSLAWSGGKYAGPYRGEYIEVDVPAQELLSLRLIDSTYTGVGVPVTTVVNSDNIEDYDVPGTDIALGTSVQSMRVYLHPPSNRFYVQKGQSTFSAVTSTGLYQPGSVDFNTCPLMDDSIYLGDLVVKGATNFDATANARWIAK